VNDYINTCQGEKKESFDNDKTKRKSVTSERDKSGVDKLKFIKVLLLLLFERGFDKKNKTMKTLLQME